MLHLLHSYVYQFLRINAMQLTSFSLLCYVFDNDYEGTAWQRYLETGEPLALLPLWGDYR